MISGIGIDIIEVARIRKKLEKNQGFKELVFAPSEIAYCESKAHPYQHYAGRFAAKEAVFKAVGTGWVGRMAYNEVVILSSQAGMPIVQFCGATAAALSTFDILKVNVSISHLKNIATAVVVIEGH